MITKSRRVHRRQLELPPGKSVTDRAREDEASRELSSSIEDITVFARIEPMHKLKIVNAFKARGHVVP